VGSEERVRTVMGSVHECGPWSGERRDEELLLGEAKATHRGLRYVGVEQAVGSRGNRYVSNLAACRGGNLPKRERI